MLMVIENVLDQATVKAFREQLEGAGWSDGQATAGSLAARVKHNEQLPDASPVAQALGRHILGVLGRHPQFLSAALPDRIHPPRFNRYQGGGHYGTHVDSAIMPLPGSAQLLRSDLSVTLFLCGPEEYDGGELTIETAFGAQQVKLAAGDLVLYPSSSLHRVQPVTRGARICSFFWLQSMVRDGGERELLYDLDQSVQALTASPDAAAAAQALRLSGLYHNLLRRWASV